MQLKVVGIYDEDGNALEDTKHADQALRFEFEDMDGKRITDSFSPGTFLRGRILDE